MIQFDAVVAVGRRPSLGYKPCQGFERASTPYRGRQRDHTLHRCYDCHLQCVCHVCHSCCCCSAPLAVGFRFSIVICCRVKINFYYMVPTRVSYSGTHAHKAKASKPGFKRIGVGVAKRPPRVKVGPAVAVDNDGGEGIFIEPRGSDDEDLCASTQ